MTPEQTTPAALDHEAHTEAIAQALRTAGLDAFAEQTGGWIYCVIVADPHTAGSWYFGMANENWGGSLIADDGDNVANIDFAGLSSTSPDAAAIARAIGDFMRGRATAPALITDDSRQCPACGRDALDFHTCMAEPKQAEARQVNTSGPRVGQAFYVAAGCNHCGAAFEVRS